MLAAADFSSFDLMTRIIVLLAELLGTVTIANEVPEAPRGSLTARL